MPHEDGLASDQSPRLRMLPMREEDMTDPGRSVAVRLAGLEKRYGPTVALKHLDLTVEKGKILALVGANGAGKSTALNIVAGTTQPTSGQVALGGEPVDLARYGPAVAAQFGLYCVHQELSLCTNLSVWENFVLAQRGADQGRVSRRRESRGDVIARVEEAVKSVFPSSSIRPTSEVDSLSLAEKQMVDIVRAAAQDHLSTLILDEPTSALSSGHAQELHRALRLRRDRGVAVIYVTHKIEEILDIGEELAVLRGGVLTWRGSVKGLRKEDIVDLLVGEERGKVSGTRNPRDPGLVKEKGGVQGGTALATVRPRGRVDSGVGEVVVRRGEVVGLAGVEGAGQREILQTVFAAASGDRRARRRATVAGRVAYVSGDRQREGVFPLWSIRDNLVIGARRRVARRGILSPTAADRLGAEWFERLEVAAPSPETPITSLSGGNQQKILVGRALASGADLLLLDDPTRGVDIGTKEVIYDLIRGAAIEQNVGVVLYSTDDGEFSICDRVYVLRTGYVLREFVGEEVSEEAVSRAAYGGEPGRMEGEAVG